MTYFPTFMIPIGESMTHPPPEEVSMIPRTSSNSQTWGQRSEELFMLRDMFRENMEKTAIGREPLEMKKLIRGYREGASVRKEWWPHVDHYRLRTLADWIENNLPVIETEGMTTWMIYPEQPPLLNLRSRGKRLIYRFKRVKQSE